MRNSFIKLIKQTGEEIHLNVQMIAGIEPLNNNGSKIQMLTSAVKEVQESPEVILKLIEKACLLHIKNL